MPIVEENGSVYISYTMPEPIKRLVTAEFLKEFRNQLFRMHNYYSLDSFADEGIPMNTSTSGWFAAFGKACLLTNNEQLLDYWRTLPWYDSDIFDGELAEMLVERGFILDDKAKVISRMLGIDEDNIVTCCKCGRAYTKDMVSVIGKDDEYYDDDWTQYKCLHCQDYEQRTNKEFEVTDYYRNVLEELDEYKKNHPVSNEEE